jgi:hypothetical protein
MTVITGFRKILLTPFVRYTPSGNRNTGSEKLMKSRRISLSRKSLSFVLASMLVMLIIPFGLHIVNVADSSRMNPKIQHELLKQMNYAGPDDLLEVIVTVEGANSLATLHQIEKAVGKLDIEYIYSVVPGFRAQLTTTQIQLLIKQKLVQFLEWGERRGELCITEAQMYANTDDLRAYPYNLDGTGVTVAVVDSGIWTGHGSLASGNVIAFKDFGTNDIYTDLNPPITGVDFNGHGTQMAGIIAGTGGPDPGLCGVAPGADLVGVKITDESPEPGDFKYSDACDALDWIGLNYATYGIDIVSCSLSDVKRSDFYNQGGDPADWDRLAWTADRLVTEHGLVVVCSAGQKVVGTWVYDIRSPGTAPHVITVGNAVDPSEGGWIRKSNSGKGPVDFEDISGDPDWYKPDILAPGTNIICPAITGPMDFAEGTGVSHATAFVSGFVALLLDYDSTLSLDNDGDDNPDVKQLLMASAVDVPGDTYPGIDNEFGAGRVDGLAAIEFLTTDISTSKYNAPMITTTSYFHGDEPMWRLDGGGYDWYKLITNQQGEIRVTVWCDPDLMVEVGIYKYIWRYYRRLKYDSSTYRGDDPSFSYTGSGGTYYIRVKPIGSYGLQGYPGDYYHISISVAYSS